MALNGIPRQLIQIPIIDRQQPGIMAIKVEHRQPVSVDVGLNNLPDLPHQCCGVLHTIDGAGAVDDLTPAPRVSLFGPDKELVVGFIDADLILSAFELETCDYDNCGGPPFLVLRMNPVHRNTFGAAALEVLMKFARILD